MTRLTLSDRIEVITTITHKEEGLVSLTAEVKIQEGESFVARKVIPGNGDTGQAVYDEVNKVARNYGYTILSKTDNGYALRKIEV